RNKIAKKLTTNDFVISGDSPSASRPARMLMKAAVTSAGRTFANLSAGVSPSLMPDDTSDPPVPCQNRRTPLDGSRLDHATEPHSAAAWQQLVSESGAESAAHSSDHASPIEE